MVNLAEAQNLEVGTGGRFLKITATDSFYSNPVFYISDRPLITTNVHGGPPAYPAVHSWGDFTKGSGAVGLITAVGEVKLNAVAKITPTSSVANYTVAEWIKRINFTDAVVELWQWNERVTTQEMIWSGFVSNVDFFKMEGGIPVVEMLFTDESRAFTTMLVGDLANKTDFPNISVADESSMISRVYGYANETLFGGSSNRNSPAFMGFPLRGYRGVGIDENLTNLQIKRRFSKNDGTSAAHTFAEPTADDPSTVGDLWVYDSRMGAYGLVDANAYTFVNDTSKLEVLVDASPKVFFFIKPSLKGSTNAAAFTDLNKLINSDPTDYIESTSTDYIWSFICPEVSFNGTIESLSVVIDVDNVHPTKNRTIRFGIWDVYAATTGGAELSYLNQVATDLSKPTGSSRSLVFLTTRYRQGDFRDHLGQDTAAEFKSGRFITRNSSDVLETNLELRAAVVELGGPHSGRDQVRLHGIAMVVEVKYPLAPVHNNWVWAGPGAERKLRESIEKNPYASHKRLMQERGLRKFIEESVGEPVALVRKSIMSNLVGTDFFARGIGQKDDGSGSITDDGAGAVISKPCDVSRHLLLEAGETINDTASSLGNFDDARASGGALGLIDDTLIQLGPQKITVRDSLATMCERFPMSLGKRKKIWDCIPDDMNPHESRSYRSTSDQRFITDMDVDPDDFEVSRIDPKSIQNSILFKYSHGYPDREAQDSYQYENPISQMYYGKKETLTIEEPWVIKHDLSAAVDTAPQAMAQWYGRRTGRERLLIQAGLTEAFYDLEIGHVTEFQNIENIGLDLMAYRDGLIDYMFQSLTATTNYADSGTPLFIAASGTSRLCIGVSKQVDRFTFPVAVAAAYTTVGAADGSEAWDYANISGAWTALTGVVNGNGLKSTGMQTVSFTRPRADLVRKQEMTFGSVVAGPCYWYSMEYNTATATGSGNDRVSCPVGAAGRRVIVMKHTFPAARPGVYPRRRTVFMEVM